MKRKTKGSLDSLARSIQVLTQEGQRRFGTAFNSATPTGWSNEYVFGTIETKLGSKYSITVEWDGKPVRRYKQSKQTQIDIQQDAINRFDVTIREHSRCYARMHAHVRERVICKWHPKKSIQATFDLFHEIGHIETTKTSMRRCESEFEATVFAINLAEEYGLTIPEKIIKKYQSYIFDELDRGIRRGGRYYPKKEDMLLIGMTIDEFKTDRIDRPHILMNISNEFEWEDVAREIEKGKVVTVDTSDRIQPNATRDHIKINVREWYKGYKRLHIESHPQDQHRYTYWIN